jgi:hypothetical protein
VCVGLSGSIFFEVLLRLMIEDFLFQNHNLPYLIIVDLPWIYHEMKLINCDSDRKNPGTKEEVYLVDHSSVK